LSDDRTDDRNGDHRNGTATSGSVEAKGLEPSDLLHAMQALYQLSYAPVGKSHGTRGNVANDLKAVP
jgi:hypothetical protein